MKDIAITLNESQWATVQAELHFAAAHHAANNLEGGKPTKADRLDTPYWKIKRIEFVRDKISKQLRAARPADERGRA